MKKDLKYYQNLPYEIYVRKLSFDEGGGYFARYKDFPYIMGDGESEALAIDDVKRAFDFCIQSDLDEGKAIPEPSDKKVRINLPKSLVDEIDKVSKNRLEFIQNAVIRALNG